MAIEEALRFAHLIGAAVALGTGSGIAFFMVMAHRTGDAAVIAHTAGVVVAADWLFTAAAMVAQPVTGALLADALGWDLSEGWILAALGLYAVVLVFWIPVVWIQRRMRDLARAAAAAGAPPPAAYRRLFRVWFAFGFPAFFAMLGVYALMITRPEL